MEEMKLYLYKDLKEVFKSKFNCISDLLDTFADASDFIPDNFAINLKRICERELSFQKISFWGEFENSLEDYSLLFKQLIFKEALLENEILIYQWQTDERHFTFLKYYSFDYYITKVYPQKTNYDFFQAHDYTFINLSLKTIVFIHHSGHYCYFNCDLLK